MMNEGRDEDVLVESSRFRERSELVEIAVGIESK
jgi:hypothetical protein